MEKLIEKIANQIEKKIPEKAEIGIILGSGLSEIVELIENKIIINYDELEDMPKTNVVGHKNQIVFGVLNGKNVIAVQGRFHYYSGYTSKQVALPVYLLHRLGVKTLIVTNSAGSTNPKIKVGDIMLITDHINFTGQNPLIGSSAISNQTQFIDMSEAYSKKYINTFEQIAKKQKVKVKKGIYMQFTGPSYETHAEVKLAQKLGADAVGMSTALEVIAAKDCNMEVLGISSISNMATGFSKHTMTHDDVLRISRINTKTLQNLIYEFLMYI